MLYYSGTGGKKVLLEVDHKTCVARFSLPACERVNLFFSQYDKRRFPFTHSHAQFWIWTASFFAIPGFIVIIAN